MVVTALSNIRLRHILLVALLLRLAWMALVPVVPMSDSVVYDLFARRIAAGQGYTWPDGSPTVYWPVGTSALYALVYAVFGHSGIAVALVNVVLGTLLVAGVYVLAQTRFSTMEAKLAAIIAALWPGWIQLTTILSSELPSTLLLVVGLAAILSNSRTYLFNAAIGAACLVLASLVRPTILPLVVLAPFFGLLMSRGWRSAVAGGGIAVVIAVLAISPWAARNFAHFDRPVLVSANFGANLWMGNNSQSNGSYMALPEGLSENEVERDRSLLGQAVDFIRNNPLSFLVLSGRRVLDSFGRETIGVTWNESALPVSIVAPIKIISSLYWIVMLGMSIVGVFSFLRERPARVLDPVVFTPALFAATAIFVVGGDRYHFGMMPFVAIFAAHAIPRALARLHPSHAQVG